VHVCLPRDKTIPARRLLQLLCARIRAPSRTLGTQKRCKARTQPPVLVHIVDANPLSLNQSRKTPLRQTSAAQQCYCPSK
jgi:hypothetical protein